MGSVDRYGNMGIEYEWVKNISIRKMNFGIPLMVLGLTWLNICAAFNDSGITKKVNSQNSVKRQTIFGIENVLAWALLVCNLAYTSEYNWWIKNTVVGQIYTPEAIISLLGDDMSKNSKAHIASAYKISSFQLRKQERSLALEFVIIRFEKADGISIQLREITGKIPIHVLSSIPFINLRKDVEDTISLRLADF